MKNEQEKLIKTIKLFTTIFGIVFLALIVFLIFFDKEMKYFWIILISGSIIIIGFTIFTVVSGVKVSEEYRKNIIMTKPKRRFKYLDTFYYVKVFHFREDSSFEYYVYHIIQDLESKKIYAIGENSTNALFQKVLENIKILRNDNIDGVSSRKDWKEINYNDEGSFWIDQELTNYYKNDGENIIIDYFGNKDEIKATKMFNRNQNYNITLLDKATFITGYAEFDAK